MCCLIHAGIKLPADDTETDFEEGVYEYHCVMQPHTTVVLETYRHKYVALQIDKGSVYSSTTLQNKP